jgi:hypothetical protein
MLRHERILSLIAPALLAVSCTTTDSPQASTLTQPGFVNQSIAAVSASSSIVFARPVNSSFCPSIAPFNVAFGITVTANGASQIAIEGVRFQFIDSFGIQAPLITLPMPTITIAAPNPPGPFAFPIVQPGSFTTLPLSLNFGCGTGRQGKILVIVDTSDRHGHHESQQVNVMVR